MMMRVRRAAFERLGVWFLGGALGVTSLLAACSDSEETSGPTGTGLTGTAGAGAQGGGTGGAPSGGHDSGGGQAGGAQSGGGGAGTGGGGPCGAVPAFDDGLSPTSEIHVATSGNDSSGDGTAGNPYATIGRAAQDLAPGSAIVVHAGTYAGGTFLSELAGNAGAPIWIGGAAGEERPVLSGLSTGLQLSRVRYLVLHDLEIEGATDNGINVDDGGECVNVDATRYVAFRRLYVHDIGGSGNQDCLKLSGVSDYVVLDSAFARCGGGDSGSGIDHVGCHAGVIARSEFAEMSGNAVQCKGGSENIEIRQNLVTDGGQREANMGGSTGFEYFRPPLSTTSPNAEARDIRVVANVFVGGLSAVAFVGCIDCLAANNTIIDPDHWVVRILQETTTSGGYQFLPCANGQFVNNLVYYSRANVATNVNVGPDTEPTSFVFANNLWYAHDNPAESTPTGVPVTESDSVIGQDPALADPGSGDYGIAAASPAAGAGQALTASFPDYRGNCFASPPSIGAFEVAP